MAKSSKNIFYKIMVLVLFVLIAFVLYVFSPDKSFPLDTGGYIPYVFGKSIEFTQHGNSESFVKKDEGWGDQEPVYRCTVEPDVFLKLYVKNNDQSVKLNVMAAGSFPEPYTSQEVTVFANGTKVAVWDVSHNKWHTAVIPAELITDNKIEIRFNMARPYIIPGDNRKLGMIVKKIRLDKIYYQQTVKKLKKWGVKQIQNVIGEMTPEERKRFEEQQ